jgi:hydrogenase maturation protease
LQQQMGRILVIGYGSPIRGDDAIGPLAAERLAAGLLPDGVEVISRHVLTADLVPDLVAAERVIFIDAAVDGEPGALHCRALRADPHARSTMAHFLDPRELLGWAQALYGAQPQAYLVSVAGANFDFAHCELSAVVDQALAGLVERVRELCTLTAADAPPADAAVAAVD